MGLDITAYRKLTKLDVLFNDEGEPVDPTTREPIDNYVRFYANPDFPGREQGVEDRGVYSCEESSHVFSRSYGGYNRWRETLAILAGYPLTRFHDGSEWRETHAAACWQGAAGPFSELINFADNEGTIGPIVAAKLAKDFAEFDSRAKEVQGDYFYDGFCELRKGLEMAADGGAISFH